MKIPITKPYFTAAERELILKPLETGWVVQGPYVEALEKKFCEYTRAKYAVAVNSCTSAQFIASRCIGIKEHDEGILPAFTWISTANAIEILGAKPVFADIDLETFNIDASGIEEKISKNTKAIFPVNLFGLPADLPEIKQIADRRALKIVEDCACSLGGWIGNQHSGTFGDCGCFSMHPKKAITTGEGGMLVTDSEDIFHYARALRDHGADRTDLDRHQGKSGFLLPEYKYVGYNYRLTDIQGAMGVAQFNKLEEILSKRKKIVDTYNQKIAALGFLKAPLVPPGMTSGWQSYVCLYKPEEIEKIIKAKQYNKVDALHEERNKFMLRLEEKGVATRQGTHAVHIQQYYARKYKINKFDYPKAYIADKLSIALPIYPQMSQEEQDYVIKQLKENYQ